jgi:hypothetical protein
MKSIDFGCSHCNRFFNSMDELAIHERLHTQPQPTVVEKPVPAVASKPKRPTPETVLLTYVYQGNCACGGQLLTLGVDVDKKYFCIAVCKQCGKQLLSKEVAKL